MGSVWMPLMTGLISGIITAVVTYFSTRSKIRLDLSVEYDKELRNKRLELYKVLWTKTEPLSRFEGPARFTAALARTVSADLHAWYFDEGGLYLSKRSRVPYFNLKLELQRATESQQTQQPGDAISTTALSAITRCASLLRDSLADDIRTRRESWL